ncbi:MAG: DUF4340 domain-containing protein [Elusimicrobia bacterium]|nr:DUF4340 domain-containing protein [Elusimicrobiota bacterium]
MEARRLAVLAAVLAALSLAAVILHWLSVRETGDAVLASVAESRVSKLLIDREGVETALEREGDSWRMVSPARDAVDGNPVGDILNALLGVKLGPEVASDPASYADYSVHEASATRIRLYTADQAAPAFDGYFGKGALGADTLYLRLAARRQVYLASGVALYQIDRHPDEFRERNVTRIDRAALESISLRSDGREVEIRKSSTGWSVSGAEVSPDKLETAVDRVIGLRVGDFSDEAAIPGKTGLDRPAVDITIRGSARSTRLLVGSPKPGPKGFPSLYRYASVEGRPALLLVAASDLEIITDLLGLRRPTRPLAGNRPLGPDRSGPLGPMHP